jgi:hypothetical protein
LRKFLIDLAIKPFFCLIGFLLLQENDISVRQIEYRIIANSKIINTLVEDTTSGDYIVDIDDDPEDDIDIQAIVAQLQQVITLQRIATGLRRNWFTRHSFAKKELAFDSLFFTLEQNPSQPDTQPLTPSVPQPTKAIRLMSVLSLP